MPRVETVNGIAICIYFADHAPPHFHARVGGREALIVIDTLAVLKSNLAPNQVATVIAWATVPANRDALRRVWAECNP